MQLTCTRQFDLPQQIVQREIEFIRKLGVEFKLGSPVGQDPTTTDLLGRGFAAVLVAVGAQGSARLPVPGSDLEGVIQAPPFLHDAKLGRGPRLEGKGVVIGGGNVAIDAARTARRTGAQEVSLACIESRTTMPAYPEMIKLAIGEGVKIYPSLVPQKIVSRNGGKASAVELCEVCHSERGADGVVRWTVMDTPDATHTMEADWIIVAIGQKIEVEGDLKDFHAGRRGAFTVDPTRGAPSVADIYAAGDIVAMPSTVTDAMAMERKAAWAIHLRLSGEVMPTPGNAVVTGREVLPQNIEQSSRQAMPRRLADESVLDFQEVELGFTREQAMAEARRCLKCKTCLHCLEHTRCVAFVAIACNGKVAPGIAGDLCEACGRRARSCIYRNIHLG